MVRLQRGMHVLGRKPPAYQMVQLHIPEFKQELVTVVQQTPYSLSADGSNNTGLEKLSLHLTAQIFYRIKSSRMSIQDFFDVHTATGKDTATAEAIFDAFIGLSHSLLGEVSLILEFQL